MFLLNVEMNTPSYLVLGTSGCFFFLNYYFCIIKYKRVYEPQKHILPHHAVKPFLHAFEFLHWPLPAAPSAHFFSFCFSFSLLCCAVAPDVNYVADTVAHKQPMGKSNILLLIRWVRFPHRKRQSWHSQPCCSSFLTSSSGLCCESKAADKLSCVLYRFQGQILYTVFTLTLAFVYIRQYMSIINGL